MGSLILFVPKIYRPLSSFPRISSFVILSPREESSCECLAMVLLESQYFKALGENYNLRGYMCTVCVRACACSLGAVYGRYARGHGFNPRIAIESGLLCINYQTAPKYDTCCRYQKNQFRHVKGLVPVICRVWV